jgi:RNA polymerase sigma-70 factor (ECF subfamily)
MGAAGSWTVRRQADLIEATAGGARFGPPRRSSDSSAAAERTLPAVVALARDGDGEALRLLYLRYADSVYGYVASIVRDPHDAEDITAEVFARLARSLGRYRVGAAPFSAWLLRVARNAALDHLRRRRSVPCADVHDPGRAADDIGRECLRALGTALDSLPAEQREVIVLRFLGGYTPREVAAFLGRSEDAVHALQHRGRRRLVRELTALGSAPVSLAA